MKVYFLLYNDFMHECKFITIKDNQLFPKHVFHSVFYMES